MTPDSDKFTRAEALYRNGYGIRWISRELDLTEKSLRLWLSPDRLTRQRELFPPDPKPKHAQRFSFLAWCFRLRILSLIAILHENRHECETRIPDRILVSLDDTYSGEFSEMTFHDHHSNACQRPRPDELAMLREEQPDLFDYV